MRKVPEEIDRLMWLVAEGQEPAAIEEFGARHPDYRGELGKRLTMVRTLKGAKSSIRVDVPPFRPPARQGPARWSYVVAAACVAALGYGAYRIASGPESAGEGIRIIDARPSATGTKRSGGQIPHRVDPKQDEPDVPVVEPSPPVTKSESLARSPSHLDKLQTVDIQGARLHQALKMIADGAKATLTIAPMTPNPEVDIQFVAVPAIKIFQELGERYGFAAFDEGEGHILVVPLKGKHPPLQTPTTLPSL